ncbi:MAG: helix-turn-helix domain-containing protein [Bulleidia sp.]
MKPAGYELSVKCALLAILSGIHQTVKDTQIHTVLPYEEKITLIKAMIIYLQQKESEPVSLIAGKYGFFNISCFNRMFRRYMHTTPGEYRKTQKGDSHEITV